jgi:hypothetical protein
MSEQMIEKTDESNQSDYSCEIASFFVLVLLSALSHFWFIVIGIVVAAAASAAIVLLVRALRSAAEKVSWPERVAQKFAENDLTAGQVFQPVKIRQSVDCAINGREAR